MRQILCTRALVAATVAAALPAVASAHVKWFVEPGSPLPVAERWFSLGSTEVIVGSLLVLLGVAVAALLDWRTRPPQSIASWVTGRSALIVRISEVLLGAFLISTAVLWEVVLTSDVPAVGTFATVLFGFQLLSGVLFLLGRWIPVAAALLGLTTLATALVAGPVSLLESAILLGLAAFHLGTRYWPHLVPRERGVAIVRIATGVSLVTLALTEKLLNPGLSLAFLADHQWNFMAPLFTPELFVLSVGLAEMLFGLLFIAGYLTRVTTVAIAVFFATSVTTMLLQRGAWEAEDLAVYAAAVLLLAWGSGSLRGGEVARA